MAGFAGSTAITTEHIQKYLDENKQLILAIVENQNLGKLNECAQYQFKLQQNLMYLAAIADAQPQIMSPAHSQVAPVTMLAQGGQAQYLQQAQQQQLIQQSIMGQRNVQYLQQSASAIQAQQQQHQHLMPWPGQMGAAAAASSGIIMLSTQPNMGGHGIGPGVVASSSFPDLIGRSSASGDNQQQLAHNTGLSAGGSRSGIDGSSGNTAAGNSGDGPGSGMHVADDTDQASYLQASEDGS